jgi:hypothetical protein
MSKSGYRGARRAQQFIELHIEDPLRQHGLHALHAVGLPALR